MRDEKFVKGWERSRKKGKIAYTLISGTLMSVSFFAGGMIAFWITGKFLLHSTIGLIIGGFIGGVIGGILRWIDNEEKYKKLAGTNID